MADDTTVPGDPSGKPRENEFSSPIPAKASAEVPGLVAEAPVPKGPTSEAGGKGVSVSPPEPAEVSLIGEIEDKLHTGNAVAEASRFRNLRELGPRMKPASGPGASSENRAPEAVAMPPDAFQSDLPKVRTYASDMSEEIRRRGTTLTTVISAEQERRGGMEDSVADHPPTRRVQMLIAGTVLLLVLGAGGLAAALFWKAPETVEATHVPLIPVNGYREVVIADGASLPDRLEDARTDTALRLGEVDELLVTRNGSALPPGELLRLLNAPPELERNSTDVMLGIHAFDRNQPFIILKTSAYDRAFAAMLSWEPEMGASLGSFFRPFRLAPSAFAETPPVLSFSDRVLENLDIRRSQEEWPIFYSFISRDLVVITTNETTLREMVARLGLQNAR